MSSPLVVIVAFRADDHLERCLHELGPAQVVVVDNDDSRKTEQIVRDAGAGYLATATNLGFAGGVNLGLRAGWNGSSDVLLLNPDARVVHADVLALQRALRDPARNLAAVGPLLIGEDGVPQAADWPLPSPGQVWFDALGASRLWRGRRFVTGAVLMLRGEALAGLGGLDERYFLYAEEADWQFRAQRAGWGVAVVPTVTATHAGAASSSDSHERETQFARSGRLFATRWYGRAGAAVMAAGSLVAVLRRCLVGSPAARRAAHASLRRRPARVVKTP